MHIYIVSSASLHTSVQVHKDKSAVPIITSVAVKSRRLFKLSLYDETATVCWIRWTLCSVVRVIYPESVSMDRLWFPTCLLAV